MASQPLLRVVNPKRNLQVSKRGIIEKETAERSCLHIREKSLLEKKLLGSRITSQRDNGVCDPITGESRAQRMGHLPSIL